MQRRRKLFIGMLVAFVLPIVIAVGAAAAQSFHSGGNITVAQNQTVNSTLFAAGRNVDVAGTVNGDIFCVSQNVSISGTVNGDVICAGQDIRVSGKINGNVRLAGQTVTVGAAVNGNATIATQTFTLDQNGSIGRDISVAGNDAILNGTVGRDVALATNTAELTNTVGRNVVANLHDLKLTSHARVNGNLTYTSKKTANVEKGAVITGSTQRHEPTTGHHNGAAFGWLFRLYALVTLLILALVVALLLPRLLVGVSDVALENFWRTLLIGFIGTLVFPVLFTALLVTVIGIPLALFLLLLWLVVLMLGCLAFAFYIGRLVFRGGGNVLLAMLVGALIVLVALMIPFLGFLVFLVDIWLGTGMVLTTVYRRYQRPAYSLAKV